MALTRAELIAAGIEIPGSSSAESFIPTGSTVPANGLYLSGTNTVALSTNGTGRLFIDSSGRLLIATSSARSNFFNSNYTGLFQVEGANNDTGQRASMFVYGSSNNAGPILALGKHRSNSIGGSTIVTSGDEAGVITFQGADGTEFVESARITAAIDGTPGTDAMPGRLVFSTTPSASATPQERLRITSAGLVGIGTSSPNSFNAFANQLVVGNGSGNNGITVFAGNTSASSLSFADGTTGADSYAGYLYYNHSDDSLSFYVNYSGSSSPRMKIDSSGRVGIGNNGPDQTLTVHSNIGTADVARLRIYRGGSTNDWADFSAVGGGATIDSVNGSGGGILFKGDGSEKARIDTSGRLLVGTSSARTKFQVSTSFGNVTPVHQFEYNSQTYNGLSITHNAGANTYPAVLALGKSRGSSAGDYTAVASGDNLGFLDFYGADGTNMVRAANILAAVDGTPGANDMPARLVFSTTKDGQSSPTEACRINSSQQLLVGGSTAYGAGQLVVHGTPMIHEAGAVYSRGASTATVVKGAYGTYSSIAINFGAWTNETSLLAEILIYGYNGIYMDLVVGKYYFLGQSVIRNINSGGFSLAYSGNTNDWTVTISKSIDVPLVKVNATVGGISAGFGVSPTITFA